jgi:hypothetical protein
MKLAMWSGPRNLSTAMMYAFASRRDFSAIDEPFYAAYLNLTGLQHPMRDQILQAQPQDPYLVVDSLLGPNPDGCQNVYHKHMTQHMIEAIPRDWMLKVTNVFLIRHPARVVASFAKKYPDPKIEDIGFHQQADLFRYLVKNGQKPIVINSADIRSNPEQKLRDLCGALGLEFDAKMLKWTKGGQSCDGVWAPHWYGAVHNSTGFDDAEGPLPILSGRLLELVSQSLEPYEELAQFSL